MSDAQMNQLLAALPGAEWPCWINRLELVDLNLGEVLHEPARVPRYVYFPTTAVVSLLYLSENGDRDEIAVIGCEGVVGVSLLMSGEPTPGSAVVQSAGQAWRMPARTIAGEFERSSAVMHLLLRYCLALGAQIAQTAVCNRHHTVSQRLSRRLLQALDRQPGRELVATQEQLAGLLGVRRESVTMEAQKLQKAGCVRYTRGHVIVLDRAALERRACECYAAVEREHQRLLRTTPVAIAESARAPDPVPASREPRARAGALVRTFSEAARSHLSGPCELRTHQERCPALVGHLVQTSAGLLLAPSAR